MTEFQRTAGTIPFVLLMLLFIAIVFKAMPLVLKPAMRRVLGNYCVVYAGGLTGFWRNTI
jgi:hypothetical protein